MEEHNRCDDKHAGLRFFCYHGNNDAPLQLAVTWSCLHNVSHCLGQDMESMGVECRNMTQQRTREERHIWVKVYRPFDVMSSRQL